MFPAVDLHAGRGEPRKEFASGGRLEPQLVG
jgi:hypothetical protein